MMTIQDFASSSDEVWGWDKGRAQYFLPYHLTPGTPGSNENPPPAKRLGKNHKRMLSKRPQDNSKQPCHNKPRPKFP